MGSSTLTEAGVEGLRGRFAGEVLTRDDGEYEEARAIFNGMIEKRPALIAQCESAADVKEGLAFARENDLEASIRSGGHSVIGASLVEDGLVIDMRRMNQVSVDPEARTATAAGGATWSNFDQATQPHALATTGGRVSTTGVAGLTLGGGSGWLERKFGLACDNLLSVGLVLADGREVTASDDEHPELFWALHGGGGNFGVATSLTFRLHPLPRFTAALMLWPAEAGREVVGRYRDFAERAPEEVGGGALYITGPPAPFVPEHLQGRLCCGALVTWTGPEAEAREQIAPLLELEPEGQMIAELPYAGLQCMLDDPPGLRNYWSAAYLTAAPDEALDRFCARSADMVIPSPSQHILFPWGGAVASNAEGSAMANRDAPWVVHPLGVWEDPADDEQGRQWARNLCADMRDWATGATYLNFVSEEGEDVVMAGHGRENYERLAAVKAEYDPDNVFHLHHPVRPRPEAAGAL